MSQRPFAWNLDIPSRQQCMKTTRVHSPSRTRRKSPTELGIIRSVGTSSGQSFHPTTSPLSTAALTSNRRTILPRCRLEKSLECCRKLVQGWWNTVRWHVKLGPSEIMRESQNICVSIFSVILLDWEFGTCGGGPTILFGSHQICRCPETQVFLKNDSTFSQNEHF